MEAAFPAYPRCPALGSGGYGAWFTDLAVWRPYVCAVARRHGLGPPGPLAVGTPGSHPVFLAEAGYVVKFFAPHWPGSHAAESTVYSALGPAPGLPAPRLLAEGELYPGRAPWPWPYLVVSRLPGRGVGELRGVLGPADLMRLARQLGPMIRALHRVPLGPRAEAARRAWRVRVEAMRAEAPARRRGERGWPSGVLARLPAYVDAALAGADDARPARLVHADLTGDHVLLVPGGSGWTISGLIDFADAGYGDPAHELVALHLDLCRCDRAMLGAFLAAYGPDPAWEPGWRRRATAWLLLFPYDVLPALRAHLPDLDAVRAPEDLEEALWPGGI